MSSHPRRSRLRLLQTLTAGAAVFALLGACGIPINPHQRPRHQRIRPIVIRLSGTWDAVGVGRDSFRPLRLTLRHAGATVHGVLHLADRELPTAWPGRIDSGGQFQLVFGHVPDEVRLHLQIEGRGRRLSGTLVSPSGREAVLFEKR